MAGLYEMIIQYTSLVHPLHGSSISHVLDREIIWLSVHIEQEVCLSRASKGPPRSNITVDFVAVLGLHRVVTIICRTHRRSMDHVRGLRCWGGDDAVRERGTDEKKRILDADWCTHV